MKLNGLDLNRIRTFNAVVEQKGYRGASEHLGLSRSAISQSITALEAQLGRPLFHRSGTKLFPTEGALDFQREVLSHYQGIEKAVDRFQGARTAGGGLLRVGAYLEFTKGKLMPAIESFLRANPRARIQFHFDSPSRLEALLERGKIDLSISIYPHRMRGIRSEALYEEELCLVGAKALSSARPRAFELASLPVIDYFPSHLLFKRWWKLHFPRIPPKISVRSFAGTAEMVMELVGRGLGVGVVPKYLLQNAVAPLQVIEPTAKKLVDYLWVSQKRGGAENSPMIASFLGAIRGALR